MKRQSIIRAVLAGGAVVANLCFGATQRALVVGINEYTNPGCSTLAGCVTDANRMQSMLTSCGGGWTSSTVKKLTNSSASRSAILSAIQSFANSSSSGDTFIYFHSSHGGNQVLCAADTNISAADLGTYLRKFPSGVKVLCVIDACHSGSLPNKGLSRAPMDFAAFISDVNETMDDLAKKDKTSGGADKLTNSQIGWCVAVDADNTSQDFGVAFGGLFTYPYIQSARSGAADAVCFRYGSTDLHHGNGDGYCSAAEAFYSAQTSASTISALFKEDAQIPQMFNESVCANVMLSRSYQANINTAADNSDLQFDSYAYELEEGYLAHGVGFFGQTKTSYSGGSALACSPPIILQACELSTTVTGSGTLKFVWKTSSDVPSSAKVMKLYVDNNEVASYTGTTWQEESISISGSGSHSVEWTYYIIPSDSVLESLSAANVNENCCYIDNIQWSNGTPPGPTPGPYDNLDAAKKNVSTASSGSVSGTNSGATSESGEPMSRYGSTVWLAWKAPASGEATFTITEADFDTVMGVYTGSDVTKLTEEVFNDDYDYPNSGRRSRCIFTAKAGTIYYICVAGYGQATGTFKLEWTGPIPDPGKVTVWFCAGAHGKRTGGGDMKQAVQYGGYATAPTIEAYPGWDFKGWDKPLGPITDNTAITAQYVGRNCGVTFDAGSKGRHVGGGNMKQTIPFSGKVTNPPGIKANTGYKFLGWNGNLNLITRSVTMTAQYDIGAYTATFVIDTSKGRHVGGGNMKQTVAYKNSPAPPGVRGKNGYVFKGWSPAISGMTKNQTYTALFEAP